MAQNCLYHDILDTSQHHPHMDIFYMQRMFPSLSNMHHPNFIHILPKLHFHWVGTKPGKVPSEKMFSMLDLWGGVGGLRVDGAFVGGGSGGESAGGDLAGVNQELFGNRV